MMKLMRAERAGAHADVIDQLYKETGTTVARQAYENFFLSWLATLPYVGSRVG